MCVRGSACAARVDRPCTTFQSTMARGRRATTCACSRAPLSCDSRRTRPSPRATTTRTRDRSVSSSSTRRRSSRSSRAGANSSTTTSRISCRCAAQRTGARRQRRCKTPSRSSTSTHTSASARRRGLTTRWAGCDVARVVSSVGGADPRRYRSAPTTPHVLSSPPRPTSSRCGRRRGCRSALAC